MLPPLPRTKLRVVRDRTEESRATGGFLDVRRLDLVAESPDGQKSKSFAYDIATRASLDAVIMAAHRRVAPRDEALDEGVRLVEDERAVRRPLRQDEDVRAAHPRLSASRRRASSVFASRICPDRQ